jgi:hypothetical protein
MKTQIIIAILLFAAPFLIAPKVAMAAEKTACCVSMEDKIKRRVLRQKIVRAKLSH